MADKSILEVAKSQIIAYNDKNWEAAKDALAADMVYDEVATQRSIKGVEEVLSAWKGWAKRPNSSVSATAMFPATRTAPMLIRSNT